jgi:uncharacterized membrane protein YfcA
MTRVLFAGLLAGIFGGLVGLGGGVVMIPLLIAWAGLTRHQAHATSLAAVIATGAVGAATYALRGRVDLLATLVLAVAAISAASWGARTARRIDALRLRRIFGAFLLAVALLLAIRPLLAGGPTHAFLPTVGSIAALVATGLVAGFVAGLLGVGGGSIMVPGMVLLAGMDQHLAQGTSLLAMVPAAIAGTVTHGRAGAVVSRVLPALIPGVLLGTLAGASLAQVLPEVALRWSFAAFVAWLGWRDLRVRPTP